MRRRRDRRVAGLERVTAMTWMVERREVRRVTLLVLVWTVVAAGPIHAQSEELGTRVWLSLGLGGGAAQELNVDGTLAFQANAQWGRHHVALRALGMGDVGSFPDGSDDSVTEVSLLYGRRRAWSFGYVAAAAGLANVSAKGLPGTSNEVHRTVGLPVVLEAGLQSPVLGLGIQGFGNLNSVATYGGVLILLQLGWMP